MTRSVDDTGGSREPKALWPSIPAMVLDRAARFAGKEALVGIDQRLTYADLAAMLMRSCRAALALGVRHGERVAIWAPNSVNWVVAALGVQAAGGTVVPMNTRFKAAEAGYILGKSGARRLFTVGRFLGVDYARSLADHDPALAEIEVVFLDDSGASSAPGASWSQYLDSGDAVPAEVARQRIAAVGGQDVSDIIFTSGTTGYPKGVLATHAQNLAVYRDYNDYLGLRAEDRYLVLNPFFHCFGFKAGWLSTFLVGATIIPVSVFDADTLLAMVEAEKVTVLPGPPTLLQDLLDRAGSSGRELSSLRMTITGSTTVPVSLVRRLRDEGLFQTVLTGYGLTESTGVVTLSRPDDDAETIAQWAGTAIPNVEVAVVDSDGRHLPAGSQGEIVVRGYNVMPGYLDDDVATAQAVDAEGWLHTGDVGVMNEAGYIKVTDRQKDMFIVGGFNAYPAEIERLLGEHPAVAKVAVVGVPDARLGEVAGAFVVPKDGVRLTAEDITAWARPRMANFKVPRHVEFVTTLPINASMKVDKAELRRRFAERISAPGLVHK